VPDAIRSEQPSGLAGDGINALFWRFWVKAGQVWPLVEIASVAGESQILRRIITTMLAGDDMLNVKRHQRLMILMKSAVFAPAVRPVYHQLAQHRLHQAMS